MSFENMTMIVQHFAIFCIREKTVQPCAVRKYPYWSSTLGADHFCHSTCDMLVWEHLKGVLSLWKTYQRPIYNVGYILHTDVALWQLLQPLALPAGGNGIANMLRWYFLLALRAYC